MNLRPACPVMARTSAPSHSWTLPRTSRYWLKSRSSDLDDDDADDVGIDDDDAVSVLVLFHPSHYAMKRVM